MKGTVVMPANRSPISCPDSGLPPRPVARSTSSVHLRSLPAGAHRLRTRSERSTQVTASKFHGASDIGCLGFARSSRSFGAALAFVLAKFGGFARSSEFAVLVAAALGFMLVGCSDPAPPAYLVVDVTTELAPGADFDTVRLDVFEAASDPSGGGDGSRPFDPISASVRAGDSFSPAYRLLDNGEQTIEPGEYVAEVTLSTGALRVDSLMRTFSVAGTTAVSFNFSEGPACQSPADCGALLTGGCAAVDCVGEICRCVCGSASDAGCESVEICGNGMDDDGDDAIDCVDSDCEGRACDDGDLCTINDVCGSGLCNAQPKDCASGDSCKTGTCNPADGTCMVENKPDGTVCDAHPNRCCSGTCVDLSSDTNNCGSCGIACATGRCDDLGNGRAACFCNGLNANCKSGTVCYDPDGTGTHPDADHCDCDSNSDCGSGALCAANIVDAVDHCYYE